jgi:hypothetical protein
MVKFVESFCCEYFEFKENIRYTELLIKRKKTDLTGRLCLEGTSQLNLSYIQILFRNFL